MTGTIDTQNWSDTVMYLYDPKLIQEEHEQRIRDAQHELLVRRLRREARGPSLLGRLIQHARPWRVARLGGTLERATAEDMDAFVARAAGSQQEGALR
jgi:hypothetical protein